MIRARSARLLGALILLVLLAFTAGPATPASADAPGPTDYRTEVKSVDPETDVFEIEIIGGDSFVLLRQRQPRLIDVVGYQGEPYLRFQPDGTVEENRRSPAVYLNEERYGDDPAGLPAIADAEADPEWVVVAEDGTYAWHDHRAHWMLRDRPFGKEPGDQILEGVIPTFVEGDAVDVKVASFWEPSPSPLPFVVGAIIGLAGAAVLWRRRSLLGGPLVLASAGCLVVGVAQYRSVPAETGPSLSLLLLPGLGLLAGIVALVVRDRRATALPLAIGGAAALVTFGATRLPTANRAILPTDLPFSVDRGVSVAATVIAACCLVVACLELSRLLQGSPAEAGS